MAGVGVEPNFLVTPGSAWLPDWAPPMPDWLATTTPPGQSRVRAKGTLHVVGNGEDTRERGHKRAPLWL